jgi:alkylhydroperoxidase family enzyme
VKVEAMSARADIHALAPEATRGFRQAHHDVLESGLESRLLHLIDVRSSQINGCVFCLDMHTLDMHTREAKASGESDERLHLVAAWREAGDVFSAREQAALAWTEAVTEVARTHVPDNVYEMACKQFLEWELIHLTVAIATINAWNRMNVAFRTPPRMRASSRT